MNDFIDVEEDIPQLEKGRNRVSICINILLKDGTIVREGFCTVDDEEFYDRNGKHIQYKKVKGWQTYERSERTGSK